MADHTKTITLTDLQQQTLLHLLQQEAITKIVNKEMMQIAFRSDEWH